MEHDNLINVNEIIIYHKLDDAFIDNLENYELIDFVIKDASRYVYIDQMPRIERIIRLHYDLNINMEGIEVIKNMLDKMETMQNTIRQLHNRLNIYENS